jgi:phenylacetate-CoA ligase
MKLEKSTYKPFGLEAIEIASRDEIAAVQTKRLKRTLENVYENVPLYRKKFDTAGVTPSAF